MVGEIGPSSRERNRLYYGDNLEILRGFPDGSVDLIYIDPPFNSKRDYNVIFDGAVAEEHAFADTWSWSGVKKELDLVEREPQRYAVIRGFLDAMESLLGRSSGMYCYLAMMSVRVVELHRVLRHTGSFYIHCDPTSSHYLKTLMDAVFGAEHFRNEIVWKRTHSHGGASRLGPVHDTILFYTKTDDYLWNPQYTPYSEGYKENFFKFQDPDGHRYRSTILTGSGVRHGASGKPWRGVDPTRVGRHWAIPGYVRPLLGDIPPSDVQAALDELDSIGRILWPDKEGGTPSFKQYIDDMEGVNLQDIWTDIPPIPSKAAERLGYPTQKPLALMDRILRSSSKKGDTVLDAFCGCGTTVAAAEKLGRQWIGIDITFRAIELIRQRLIDHYYGNEAEFERRVEVLGVPKDLESARHLAVSTDPLRKQFEKWACTALGGVHNEAKGPDAGVDGFIPFKLADGKTQKCLIQVKSGRVTITDIQRFNSVLDYFRAPMGVFFTLEKPTSPMTSYVAQLPPYKPKWGGQELVDYPRLQIITVEEHFHGKRPEVPLAVKIQKNAMSLDRAGPGQARLTGTGRMPEDLEGR